MSIQKFVKPVVPMNPLNNNWDKTTEERITELERKMEEMQVELFTILRSILDEIEKEKVDKLINENEEVKEEKEEIEIEEIKKVESMPQTEEPQKSALFTE